MKPTRRKPSIGAALYFLACFGLGAYFTFAAVQGDYGVLHRIQIEAETAALEEERDRLELELADLRNKTRRLSDDYLDLDLLDERARRVLGMMRADEIIIR
ncbi:septum formation initiator family protein [Actibacterium pelagium]|uniref:Septum formation initiator n=1 Tax=Actibacterium pelagium TaxID=2029103 RepID=A0A917ACE2_9RHOB|nr:septum formation initiator family protein [Actibacterium pelagium]GGE40681.1 septum formation initiator precursor [Actibacterium pelagium]